MDESTSMSLFGSLIIVLLVLGILALVIFGIIYQNRKVKERRQQLITNGYTPVDRPDAALLARLVALHGRKGQRYRLRNVFRREVPEGEIILYDLWETGGDDNSSVTTGAMALIAPTLHLPQMMLMTHPNLPDHTNNLLVKAAEKLINWSAGLGGMKRIYFPDNYHFDSRYYVMAKDEDAVRAFLDDTRLIYLASMSRGYQIAFNDNAFSLAREIPRLTGSIRRTDPDYQTMLEDARLILRWME